MFKTIIRISALATLSVLAVFTDTFGQTKAFKDEFLYRINTVRQQGCNCGSTYMPPVPPLVWSNDLAKAADGHAYDMYRKGYFDHNSRDGRTMQSRILAAGYKPQGYKSFAVGENIALGQESIAEVSDGWFKSVGHCKNLMNPDFREIGIAVRNKYWVQDFGGREAFTPEEQRLIKSGRLIIRRSTSRIK